MNDILYLAGTLVFFAAMLGYVAACERLGRGKADDSPSADKARP